MKKVIDIPFDEKGNQLNYPPYRAFWYELDGVKVNYWSLNENDRRRAVRHQDKPITRKNFEFVDTLLLVSVDSNIRAGARATFRRQETNTTVVAFLSEFNDMIPHMTIGTPEGPCIRGRFTFKKRGANFSVTYLGS